MGNTRTVSFFSLTIDTEKDLKAIRKATRQALTNSEVEELFLRIFTEYMMPLKHGSRAVEVETLSSNRYVIEVLDYKDHQVFARIGQPNATNTMGIRDTETLESSEVPIEENQLLETYTYTLIDLNTGIVCYIGIYGAPRISAVKELFNLPFTEKDHTKAYISAILSDDIIKQIAKKDRIGSITVSIAMPSDNVLEENVYSSPKLFDAARNVKRKTKTYEIVAKRKKSLFDSNKYISSVFQTAQQKYGEDLVQFSVRANDFDEQGQDYNLLNYHFTKKTTLKADKDHDLLDAATFRSALEKTYKESYKELIEYIR